MAQVIKEVKKTTTPNSKNKIKKIKQKHLTDALYKKALGYKLEEIVEEFVKDKEDDELILTKRKVSYKNIQPDISAVKMLLEINTLKNTNNIEN